MPADVLHYASASTDIAFQHDVGLQDAFNANFIQLGDRKKNSPVSLMVWGDSHARAVLPAIDALCKEHSVHGVAATHSGTAPLVGYQSTEEGSLKKDSLAFNNAVIDYIRNNRVRNVIIVARWDYYIISDNGTDRIRSSLRKTIAALESSGTKIWIMRQVPKHPWRVPYALAYAVFRGKDPEKQGLPLENHEQASRIQDPIFEGLDTKIPNVMILDPTSYFVDSNMQCRVARGGEALYCDDNHLSSAGAAMLRPLFHPVFEDFNTSKINLIRDQLAD